MAQAGVEADGASLGFTAVGAVGPQAAELGKGCDLVILRPGFAGCLFHGAVARVKAGGEGEVAGEGNLSDARFLFQLSSVAPSPSRRTSYLAIRVRRVVGREGHDGFGSKARPKSAFRR